MTREEGAGGAERGGQEGRSWTRHISDVPKLRAWYMAFFGPVEIW